MNLRRKALWAAAIVLNGFLAVTAIAGGAALLTGMIAMPLSQLEGTLFHAYTLPGLALFAIVGGSSLLAMLLLIRKNRLAPLFSVAAGVVIMFFEFVEVLTIGSPAGIAQTLQLFYFGWGVLIVIVSLLISLADLLVGSQA